ncbi:MAG TPA: CRISPR-associated endonuclease Cas1 [Phycisphaerae bacterium]|nr:CRISPR-associated endonuclease Cas1 [Phycisphaerae bacterium]
MAVAYLTQQGTEISRKGDALVVKSDGQVLADLEVHHLDSLCIFGRVHLTLPAVELLLGRSVDTAFLTLDGRLKGRLAPSKSSHINIRLEQFRQFENPDVRLPWAKAIVRAKLWNAAEFVRRFAYNHPDSAVSEHAAEIASYCDRVNLAGSIAELRGVEGAGTRSYFNALRGMCLGDLSFNGRTSRPPRDPFNALLSFGYVLLSKELTSLLEVSGLDPYLGFYHEPEDGRPGLATDLIEEFRHPLIDRFCLTLNNKRMLSREDFTEEPENGVRLRPESLKRYLGEYDQWMRSSPRGSRPCPRDVVRRQVELLTNCVRFRRTYDPYRFED